MADVLSQVGAPLRHYVSGGEFVANRDMPDLGVKVGERVPWRDLGIHEVRMYEFWRANMVDCVPATVQVAESTQQMPGIASSQTASQLTRAERRAQRR